MKIEFDKKLLRIVPENECDNLFLDAILNVNSGKVYSKVCDRENRFGKTFKTIELSAFRENFSNRKASDIENEDYREEKD